MIELFTVIETTDMNNVKLRVGSTNAVSSYDDESWAKRRRTQMANRYPDKTFGILVTEIYEDGFLASGWMDKGKPGPERILTPVSIGGVIQQIKALRAEFPHLGLKEAKDIVEGNQPHPNSKPRMVHPF